jgi:hypothetical protein
MTTHHPVEIPQEGPSAMMVRALVRLGFVVVLIIVLALTGCAALPSNGQQPASAASSNSPTSAPARS